uniref:TPR_REGION domain-containing protein n=1 Tax=Angiostrongylus cantonensis TaxID=6313 RepID=A0A0K0DGT9_ANGCA
MTTANDRAVLNHILNPLMPTDVSLGTTIEADAPITADGIEESRRLEIEGIRLAENGEHDQAIEKLSEAIQRCSVNPSAFNNRAQALRLVGRVEDSLRDLDQAITLSNGHGKSACQAFVQRALIHRLRGDDESSKNDFQKAAELGSSFAKMQVVALNPYAAMCNKMLSEVFTNLKEGKNEY